MDQANGIDGGDDRAFESGQVRFIDDQKVISYGTSSYGYDVRCASEFKIFTNVHTTNVVDPKILMRLVS